MACLALSIGIIAWVALAAGRGRFGFSRGWLLLFAFGLLWATLRALWVRFDEPDGRDTSRSTRIALRGRSVCA